jgi:hypothetical protein
VYVCIFIYEFIQFKIQIQSPLTHNQALYGKTQTRKRQQTKQPRALQSPAPGSILHFVVVVMVHGGSFTFIVAVHRHCSPKITGEITRACTSTT